MDRGECLIRSLFSFNAFSRFKPLNSAKFNCVNVFWEHWCGLGDGYFLFVSLFVPFFTSLPASKPFVLRG